jgi:hypothetical protein
MSTEVELTAVTPDLSGLTAKQAAFVRAYLADPDPRAAYLAAGYAATNERVIAVGACQVFRHFKVQAAIQKAREAASSRAVTGPKAEPGLTAPALAPTPGQAPSSNEQRSPPAPPPALPKPKPVFVPEPPKQRVGRDVRSLPERCWTRLHRFWGC